MDFGEVLSKAWKITWKHKVLWIFGIFAGCARGGGGGSSYGGGGGTQNPSVGPGTSLEAQQFITNVEQWIGTHESLIVAAVILLVLLVLILVFIRLALGTIGEVGLIRGTFEVDGGAEHLAFSPLFKETLHYFWRVLGLSLLVGLVLIIAILLLVGCAFAAGVATRGIGVLIFLPFLCLLLPAAVVGGIIVQLADVAIVTQDVSLMDGLRRGWEVFKKQLGPALVIWLITWVLEILGGILIAIPILVVAIPALLSLAFNTGNFSWTPLIIAGACFVAYLPILIVASGLILAYIQSVWTLTYMRLTRPPAADPTAPALPANA